MVHVFLLLTSIYFYCVKKCFQSQVFLIGTSCYFPLWDSTHRLLFELWLNYKELLKANKMIYNSFRAKLILLRYESQLKNMLILCSKTESSVPELFLLHLTLNLQLCKITAVSSSPFKLRSYVKHLYCSL